MIIIKKTKAGFHVVNTAGNGEILNSSEVLNSKQSAWKNISSNVKENYHFQETVYVKDCTEKLNRIYLYNVRNGKKIRYKEF